MNPDPRIQAPRAEAAPREEQLDFLELLSTLWRRKWTIALWMLAFMVLGAYYAFAMVDPKYSARTVLAFDDSDQSIVAFDSIAPELSADYLTIQTEIEIMQGRNLVGKLVDALDLTADPDFNPYLEDPEEAAEGPGLLARAITAVFGEGEDLPPPDPAVVRNDTIDMVLLSLRITNIRNTRVFHINVITKDPEKSALIADTLAELYILGQLEAKFEATQKATKWLTDRVAELKIELEAAEGAVKAFNTDTDLVSPEKVAALNLQLGDFRNRLNDMVTRRTALQLRVDALEAAAASADPVVMAEAADDAGLNQIAQRIQAGGDALRTAFDQRFAQILERARFELNRNESQRGALETSIGEIQAQVGTQSANLLKLEQLQREAEASRVIYEYFLGRLKEASVQQGIQQADSLVVSNAVVPKFPSSPRAGMIIFSMMLFGGFVGTSVIALSSLRKRDVRSAQDLETLTGISTIGRIPRDSAAKPAKLLKHLMSKPTSGFAEAVRDLRTSVLLSNIDHEPQVIMMVSSVPSEGKTTMSVSMAESLAGMRKRVLLIEGDLRRRTLDKYFDGGDAERPGLVSAVAGKATFESAIHRDEASGIDVLLGERTRINAADFFSSDRFRKTLAELRTHYDVIIIDTPPVLIVPDARLIGQHADAVVYVVRWGKTLRSMVRQGLASLAAVNVKTTGLVLSQIDVSEATRHGEYYGAYGKRYYNR